MKPEIYLMSKDDLIEAFREVQKEEQPAKQSIDKIDKMDRRQASKFLDVSYPTMHNWTKKGILKEHGQGRKKFYLRNELIQVMQNNS